MLRKATPIAARKLVRTISGVPGTTSSRVPATGPGLPMGGFFCQAFTVPLSPTLRSFRYGLCDDHAVAPLRFGLIESFVSGAQEGVAGRTMGRKHSDAAGNCNYSHQPPSVLDAHLFDCFSYLLSPLPCDIEGGVGQDQHKFFAADTAGNVSASNL